MWNRISYDDWVVIVPIVAFVLTFSVFVILVVRTLLMKKSRVSELAQVPLSDQPTKPRHPRSES